jgi:hypothetical protein
LRAYKEQGFTKDGTPMYFTRENITDKLGGVDLQQKADHFEKLSQMYTKDQVSVVCKFICGTGNIRLKYCKS